MLKFKFFLFLSIFLFSSFSVFALNSENYLSHKFESEDIKIEILEVKDCENSSSDECKELRVKILSGSLKGRVHSLTVDYLDLSQKNTALKVGGKFFATYDGQEENGKILITLGEVDRTFGIFILLLIFIVLVIAISGKQGILSLLALLTNFVVLIFLVANGVFSGFNSLLLVLLGGVVLLSFSMFITYGFNRKSFAAFLGSVSGLLLTVILALIFIPFTKMTGFSSEEASFLSDIMVNVSMKDVLFVGICVGILGILDDVTINQSSLTFQLVSANPKLSKREIFFKAMTVGKDHLSSMVNTLIIAYAGASFPLFLLLIKDPSASILNIINMEIISEEILRMLIGSIGLILTIPISTYIATVFAKNKKMKLTKL